MALRINDFECLDCGFVEERLHKIDDETQPDLSCNKCGSVNLQKKLSAPKISYSATSSLTQSTPDGFKDILRNIQKTTPDNYKGATPSAI